MALSLTASKVSGGRQGQKFLSWVGLHAVAIALAIGFIAPILFIILTALMSDQQALTKDLWPTSWHWENFATVFEKAPLLQYFFNSLLYAGLATVFMLISSVPVAYALSRMKWRGRNTMFYLVIVAMMLPPQVVAVPMYVVWAQLGLTGTLWPLIIPNLFGDAFSIFLLRQFLITIPQSYSDSARVDGASEFGVLCRIILPMARPGIAAAALFSFLNTWNDYFGPILYTGENTGNWTLSLGLASFRSVHQVQWNLTMAATLLVMAPVILLFFFAQKQFIEGIKFSGVKG
ncbi:carbohydrate ABC transporter permease [Paenarthrobacter sp. GOM3]|uniref:carbohydrate ABC transporter permease n=1 Tax=Paenarthrobacter sp. GOM3 TaxID=2782567 RepID=UPI001BA8366D|nr:carbohydrate ABC transporter permease [Paenarthrobacter sp. GOM3]WOH19205.1 carbohydrate ABC transporter permease [Paenarthrobacter sp. GOM3]